MERIKQFFKQIIREAVKESVPVLVQKNVVVHEKRFPEFAGRLLNAHVIDEEDIIDNQPENERRELCKVAYDVLKFKELEVIKRYLINDVISDAIRNGKSMDEIDFNKATINGIEIFFDELKRLASTYQVEIEEDRKEKLNEDLNNLL